MYSQILDKNRNVYRAVLKLFMDEELQVENRPDLFPGADGIKGDLKQGFSFVRF